jgi:hypothetical protein
VLGNQDYAFHTPPSVIIMGVVRPAWIGPLQRNVPWQRGPHVRSYRGSCRTDPSILAGQLKTQGIAIMVARACCPFAQMVTDRVSESVVILKS